MRTTLRIVITVFLSVFFVVAHAQDYLQIGFTSSSQVPVLPLTTTARAGLIFPSNPELTVLFENIEVTEIRRTYPAADRLAWPFADTLKLVYDFVLRDTSKVSQLARQISSLKLTSLTSTYAKYAPRALYTPNDYYNDNTGAPENAFHHTLDLINAQTAWEYTQGLECIKVGITDIQFQHHNQLAGKVAHVGTGISILPANSGSAGHGMQVAGSCSVINDDNAGKAALGGKIQLGYYQMNFNGILEAIADGCKVVNCSWMSMWSATNNYYDNNEFMILENARWISNVTVVAAAGNGRFAGNPNFNPDWFVWPASYGNLLSVTSVGSQHPLNHVWNANWKDCHRQFMDPNDSRYDNYHQNNDEVDLCAPGYWFEQLGNNNTYVMNGGTSSAAPQVSAAAALLYSINPNFTAWDVEQYLRNSATNIYGIHDNYIWNGKLGSGRLDVGAAIIAAKNSACEQAFNSITWEREHPIGSNNYNIIYPPYYGIYNHLQFSVNPGTTPDSEIDWIIVYDGQKVTKIGSVVDVTFGTSSTDDFQAPTEVRERCGKKIEIYVRRGTGCCYSAYYKEQATFFEPDHCNRWKRSVKSTSANQEVAGLKISPNPAKNQVVVEGANLNGAEFQVFDVNGKLQLRGRFGGKINTVDVTKLSKGTYFLRVQGQTSTFVKL